MVYMVYMANIVQMVNVITQTSRSLIEHGSELYGGGDRIHPPEARIGHQ